MVVMAVIGHGAAAPRPAENIVVLGDSLAAGYNLAPGEGFAPRLEKWFARRGLAVNVGNASVSGDTSAAGRARLHWSVTGTPDLVIVELGANDALRGIDPAVTRANLAAILAALRERGLKVLLAGMRAPPNMGAEYEAAFNRIYPGLAGQYAVPLYPFFLEGVAAHAGLVQTDGKHPTAEGIEVMVAGIAPLVARALGLDPEIPGEGER